MIKILLKSIVIWTIIFSFTSCASSGVLPLDKGVYYISKGKEVKRINNIYTYSGYRKTANFALEFSCIKN